MSIAAKVSAQELEDQVKSRFVGAFFEGRLINAPGVSYIPGTTDDASFLGFEAPLGEGGYLRQVISYDETAVSSYTDDGIGLSTRATVFAHDGVSGPIEFSHVALVWSSGNVTEIATPTVAPVSGIDGTYNNIPIDSTDGDGQGMTVNLVIINDGLIAEDFGLLVGKAGVGFEDGDTIQISAGTLAGLGAISNEDQGGLVATVTTAPPSLQAGQIMAVAQTSSQVQLTGGNEAAFYWNIKQFGYYAVSSS